MSKVATVSLILLIAIKAFSDATIPTADRKGSKDNPLLQRYEGSFIVAYEQQSFGEFTFPLSKLEAVPGEKRDSHSNLYFKPKQKKTAEGAYTH